MKTKRLEIKEISPEGSFDALLSPYGNVDLGGEAVIAGAFSKTLKEKGNKRPLLWQHKTDVPIGELTLEDRPDGLWCRGQLLMALPEAQKAYLLMKAKIVKGMSIGFETIKDQVENGVRKLLEVKLYEGSVVTFPMNEQALIASVKGTRATKGDFNEELTEVQLGDAGYQMHCALRMALSSATWSDLTREEKISAAETVIQQFSDAYMAYYPAYLDMMAEEYGAMEMWSKRRFEIKAGARHSAATKDTIQSAIDLLVALMADAADEGDATLKAKAGTPPVTLSPQAAADKPEPDDSHSAAKALVVIGDLRALLK